MFCFCFCFRFLLENHDLKCVHYNNEGDFGVFGFSVLDIF